MSFFVTALVYLASYIALKVCWSGRYDSRALWRFVTLALFHYQCSSRFASGCLSTEEFFADFNSCFTKAEWAIITTGEGFPSLLSKGFEEADASRLDPKLWRFYWFWCLKESFLKAVGTGLIDDLRRIEFSWQDEASNNTIVTIDKQQLAGW